MRIRASLPGVRDLELNLRPSETLASAKSKVCAKLGIEYEHTRLLLAGRPLPDKTRLAKLNLKGRPVIVDYLWARHLLLWGHDGQRKIRGSRVMLAGAGAIGNEVAKNLAMLGVKQLKIVDRDLVELSNTSRMVFFSPRDVGKPKADTLAAKLQASYPYTTAKPIHASVESVPLSEIIDSDLIVCGLDNVLSRIYLSEISRKYLVPIVDGGIAGYQGRVQVYVPPDWPCPICTFPSQNYAQLAGLRNPCDAPAEEARIPSLPTTVSMVSSVQTQEAVKLLIGYDSYRETGKWPESVGEPLAGILIADLKFNRYSIMQLKRNERCLVCGKEGVAREVIKTISINFSKLRNSPTALVASIKDAMNLQDCEVDLFVEGRKGVEKVNLSEPFRSYGIKAGLLVRAVISRRRENFQEVLVRLA